MKLVIILAALVGSTILTEGAPAGQRKPTPSVTRPPPLTLKYNEKQTPPVTRSRPDGNDSDGREPPGGHSPPPHPEGETRPPPQEGESRPPKDGQSPPPPPPEGE